MKKELVTALALAALGSLQGCASLLSEDDKRALFQATHALSGAANQTQQQLLEQERARNTGRLDCDPTWNGGMTCSPASY